MDQVVAQLIGTGTPMSILCVYLIWRQMRDDKIAEKRIEVDKEIAASMATLATVIQNMGPR